DQERLFENYWLKIENNVSIDKMPDFIMDYLLFACREAAKISNAYELFKKTFRTKNYTNESMLQELLRYSEYYKAFLGLGVNKYSQEVNRCLKNFRDLDQSTIYPFLFHIFDDFTYGKITEVTLDKVMNFFLTYILRRLVCGESSNKLRGLFKTLYQRAFTDESKYDNYFETITQCLYSLSTQCAVPSDATFKDALMNGDLFHKKKVCKFIMNSIENVNEDGSLVKDPVNLDFMAVEHIMPQILTDVWKNELGPNYSQTYDRYLDTLGNLSITGYSYELGNKTFSEKKEMIADKQSHIVKLNEDILNQDVWNETAISMRADKLSKKLLAIYKMDRPYKEDSQNKIERIVKDRRRLTIGEDFDPTGTKVESFIFLGQAFKASTYADLINQLLCIFYDLDGETLEELAGTDFKITPNSKPYMSLNKSLLRNPVAVGDSGIYYETNLNTKATISFIRAIMDAFGFEDDDLILYIRQTSATDSRSSVKIGEFIGYDDTRVFHTVRKGSSAYAMFNPVTTSLIILEGSEIDMDKENNLPASIKEMRNRAFKDGIIKKEGDRYILQQPIELSTPTAACYFVYGKYASGWGEWRDDDNQSLDAIYRNGTTDVVSENQDNDYAVDDDFSYDNFVVQPQNDRTAGMRVFHIIRKSINAYGVYDAGIRVFTVLAGSEIDMIKDVNVPKYIKKIRQNGLLSGDIIKEGDKYILQKSIELPTPTAGCFFVLGLCGRGWNEWIDDTGATLDDVYRRIE
ncbi:MAG: DUF4357 domain-containing protein, partial [Prevotella sp.]|nr:DUF4357 domain-containing protein [Prevotella sp.]